MNKTQSNFYTMLKAVCGIFENNKNILESNQLLYDGYNRLLTVNINITKAAAKQQENAPQGYTAAKDAMRVVLSDKLFLIGRRLRAFARLENDAVAEEHSVFSRSSLDLLSHNNLLHLSRAIIQICKLRIDKLSNYEINSTILEEFETSVNQLDRLASKRDVVVDERMENTSSLIELLATARQELRTMDALVEGFVEDEAFLSIYFNARRVIDLRGSRKAVRSNK
jgi:hypothetical protein